jgi:hypothetical protein
MACRIALALVGLISIPSVVRAEAYHATVYQVGSAQQKVLFQLLREESVQGTTLQIHSRFTDPASQAVEVSEETTLEGGKLLRYVQEQRQLGARGELELRDGKAWFSWTQAGKTEKDSEDAAENLIVGPTTVSYLQKNWETLMKGDTVPARWAALDRKETVGFKFFRIAELKWNGQDAVQIKMKPSSFVIAALVDPLIFTFDKDGKHLLELVGRTLPKQKVDGKWKDLDADIVYRY